MMNGSNLVGPQTIEVTWSLSSQPGERTPSSKDYQRQLLRLEGHLFISKIDQSTADYEARPPRH